MYNSDIKELFIKHLADNEPRIRIAEVTFKAIEPFEVEYETDISQMDLGTLNFVLGEVLGFRGASKKTRASLLNEYVNWCIENGYAKTNYVERVDRNALGDEKLKRQTVINPRHLQKYLDYYFEPEGELTVDCTFRCFYWLAFSGIGEDRLLELTAENIDFSDMTINCDGKQYPIYREAIPSLKACAYQTEFRYKHPGYSKVITKERGNSDWLLRGFSDLKRLTIIRARMSKATSSKAPSPDDSINLKLSYFRVWLSGIFYRAYEAENAGEEVDFMEAAADFIDGKTYKLDKGRNLIGAKQRRVAKEYLIDYERWKRVHKL